MSTDIKRSANDNPKNTSPYNLKDRTISSLNSIEGFHSCDLYTKVNYFEGVATQQNNDSYSKRLFQFAKSQEFFNVGAVQIFEHNVLLFVLNSRKIFERDLLSSDSVSQKLRHKTLGFLRLICLISFNNVFIL